MVKMMSNSQIALWEAISVYGHSTMCHSTMFIYSFSQFLIFIYS
jgi:hypothetical protein